MFPPQVRTQSFTAQPPDLQRLILYHESFAVHSRLRLIGTAFYPVLVHRLTVSIGASSPRSVTLTQLRFTSFAVVNSREDLHLQRSRPCWAHYEKRLDRLIAVQPFFVAARRAFKR